VRARRERLRPPGKSDQTARIQNVSRRRRLIVLLLLAVGVGCTSDGGFLGADDRVLAGPGEPLAEGLEVQPGSRLVATPLPYLASVPPKSDPGRSGWQALLLVDGEPTDVWDRYVEELGLPDQMSARGACIVRAAPDRTPRSETTAKARLLTDPRLGDEDRLECHGSTAGISMDLLVGPDHCFEDARNRCRTIAGAHLLLRAKPGPRVDGFIELGSDELRFERSEGATDARALPLPSGPLVKPRLDRTRASRFPKPGERFDAALDHYLAGTKVALVPKGARSLVPPAMLLNCNSGLVAMLELPGSPVDAVRVFDDADDGDVLVGGPIRGRDERDREWAAGRIETAGGYVLSMTAVADGRSSIVLLTECGD